MSLVSWAHLFIYKCFWRTKNTINGHILKKKKYKIVLSKPSNLIEGVQYLGPLVKQKKEARYQHVEEPAQSSEPAHFFVNFNNSRPKFFHIFVGDKYISKEDISYPCLFGNFVSLVFHSLLLKGCMSKLSLRPISSVWWLAFYHL